MGNKPECTWSVLSGDLDIGQAVVVSGFETCDEAVEWAETFVDEDSWWVIKNYQVEQIHEAAAMNEIDESLAKLQEAGLIEWVGIDENGEPTYSMTEEGERVAKEKFDGQGK